MIECGENFEVAATCLVLDKINELSCETPRGGF